MKNTSKYLSLVLALATLGSVAFAVPVLAASSDTAAAPSNSPGQYGMDRQGGAASRTGHGMMGGGMMGAHQGVMPSGPFLDGIVTAVSGNILTLSGRVITPGSFGPVSGSSSNASGFTGSVTSPTQSSVPSIPISTYTVDATNAIVTKNNASSTVSAIARGDMLMVQGTISGTNVTATAIRDGFTGRHVGMGGMPGTPRANAAGPNTAGSNDANKSLGHKMFASSTSASVVVGNGQPVIAGTISSISGSTLIVTNKSNVQYSVDASNAKITQGSNTVSTLSSLSVGNTVMVQGTVNGTSVVASTVIDQTRPVNASTAGAVSTTGTQSPHPGVFGQIGKFFSHIFGF